MRKFCLSTFFLTGILISKVHSQNAQDFYKVVQKYFLVLPYEKKIGDWFSEITSDERVEVDFVEPTDSTSRLFLKGYNRRWAVFEELDSIKFYAGQRAFKSRTTINGSTIGEGRDSVFYLRQIFYFPLAKMPKKEWKELCKNVLQEFKKSLKVTYPVATKDELSSKSAKLVWFISPSLTFSLPIVSFEYGSIEERSLCYIILDLNFRSQGAE